MPREIDSTKWININGEALRQALKKRNLKTTRISNELGCGCSITNAISRGKIAKPIAKLLESEYGIALDELRTIPLDTEGRKVTKPEEIIIAPQFSEEQWARLEGIIKNAMLEALKGL